MTNREAIEKFAESIRDAIDETDESSLRGDPEHAFLDFAARLVLHMDKNGIVIVPANDIEIQECVSARNTLRILTEWLGGRSERYFLTDFSSEKFEIILRSSGTTEGYFRGESVQDAYAQAAQTISFNGGDLRE